MWCVGWGDSLPNSPSDDLLSMSFRVSTIADQLPATIYKQREKPEANDEVEEGVLGKRRRDDETLLRKDAIRRKYLWSAERVGGSGGVGSRSRAELMIRLSI